MKLHYNHALFLLCVVSPRVNGVGNEADQERRCHGKIPSQLDFARLDDKMTGRLIFPEPAEDYSKYNFQWNLRTKTFPLVHALVKSAEDIREAVLFARTHDLPLTVKSSGHDFLGRSSADYSFTINLMDMKVMTVTKDGTSRSEYGELKVQTGATWAEIYQEVDKYDRVVVGGSAHTVTPGGYTLGGGHSPLSPSLGLAVDNVLEIQVVLADGRISTCTEERTIHVYPDGRQETESNGDLFWALRGGGGGTFGVVVYYVFKLHQAPLGMVKVTGGVAFYINTTNELLARDVLNGYNNWVTTASPQWGGFLLFHNNPVHIPASAETGFTPYDLMGTFTFAFNKFGPWDEDTAREPGFLYDLKDKYPAYVIMSVENKTSFWDYEKDVTDAAVGRIYTLGSLIPAENYNETLTQYFLDEFLYNSGGVLGKGCTVIRIGGKVKDYPLNSSSIHPGWRSAQTVSSCGITVSEWYDFSLATYERQERLKDKVEGFAQRLRRFGYGEYLNEGDDNNPNWKRDFWGENYDRLLTIKLKYDPHNFFTCHHCVGSDISVTMTTTSPDVCQSVNAAPRRKFCLITTILIALWIILI